MIKLFKKLLLLTFPFAVIYFYSEYRLSSLDNSYKFRRRALERQIAGCEILLLGSSHGVSGINPEYLTKSAFNAANVSQTVFYDKEILLKYIGSAKELETVVLPVSYFTLWSDSHTSKEAWREYFYYRFSDIKHPDLNPFEPAAFSFVALYTPGKVKSYLLRNFDVNLVANEREDGWRGYPAGEIKRINYVTGKRRVALHHSNMLASSYTKNMEYLEEILAAAEKRGIEVVLVATPVYRTYSKFTKEKYKLANMKALKALRKEFDMTYLDYSNDKRFTINDFYDNDHLNYKGAAKFTRILNEKLM
ncbi:DUF1574 family protein [Pontibacter pamirensis]|uniref:DUF1574 family protein n=1 Tax=Pontibacter pamirensis TaxID=2562824 RepID=UPI00138A4CBF|nr:DUF1574 family protein [Pontibacter pamirensis]